MEQETLTEAEDYDNLSPVFDYDVIEPLMWQDAHAQCRGARQSPVDLRAEDAVARQLPPLLYHDHWNQVFIAKLQNTGHSAKVSVENWTNPAILSGGPLQGRYMFSNLHFHWGANSMEGSEHTLDGQSLAMEAHLVYYKQHYGSVSRAARYQDGVAVVAFLLQVGQVMPNILFEMLTAMVPFVQRPNVQTELPWAFAIEWLHSSALPDSYYTYNGSLTTPPCTEGVTWVVYPQPVLVSDEQVAVFRSLRTKTGAPMMRNYRPPQPLNDRELLYATPQTYVDQLRRLQLFMPKQALQISLPM